MLHLIQENRLQGVRTNCTIRSHYYEASIMNKKTIVTTASALALGLTGFASNANAALITHNGTITEAGTGSADYYSFSTTASGNTRIETFTPNFDSMLYLFVDDGNLTADDARLSRVLNNSSTSTALAFDDDSGTENPSNLGYSNSRLDLDLPAGDYLTAVADFEFTLDEAVAGTNDSGTFGRGFGDYRLEIDGPTLAATDNQGGGNNGNNVGNNPNNPNNPNNNNGGGDNGSDNGNNNSGNGGSNGGGGSSANIPEPATLGIFGLALAGFASVRRVMKKSV